MKTSRKADKAIAVLKKSQKIAQSATASKSAIDAVKKSKTRTISAIKTRGMTAKAERYAQGKLAHAKRNGHIRLTEDSIAAKWVVKQLLKHGALTRSELISQMQKSKKVSDKIGSLNWCLDQLQNDFLIIKEQKHGGKYTASEHGRKAVGF